MKVKVPEGGGNVSHGGIEYEAKDGFVDVPEHVLPHIAPQGYRKPTAEEQAKLDTQDEDRAANPDTMTRTELLAFLRAANVQLDGRPSTDELRENVKKLLTGGGEGS